jgi:hypothetical protein
MKGILLFGESGTGKDTFLAKSGLNVIKFAAPMKRQIEANLGLPTGILENRAFRQAPIVNGSKGTYLDLMLAYFEMVNEHCPHMYHRQIEGTIGLNRLAGKEAVIFNDIRTPAELALVQRNFNKNELHYVRIKREGYPGLASDRFIDEVTATLDPVIMTNDLSLASFQQKGLMYLNFIGIPQQCFT